MAAMCESDLHGGRVASVLETAHARHTKLEKQLSKGGTSGSIRGRGKGAVCLQQVEQILLLTTSLLRQVHEWEEFVSTTNTSDSSTSSQVAVSASAEEGSLVVPIPVIGQLSDVLDEIESL